MRSITLMLGAIYFWYVAANINKKHEKSNFFRGNICTLILGVFCSIYHTNMY